MQAMNHLSTQAMIGVTNELLTTNHDELKAQPELTVPLQLIDKAHTQLITLFKTTGQTKQIVQKLTNELTQADARHDRKARGVHAALSAWLDLTDDPELAQQLIRVRDDLFPIGLSVTQRSYREQAGAALQTRQFLTPATCDILAACTFAPNSLLTETYDWLDTAQNIGEMQAERSRLLGDSDDDTVSQSNLRDARFAWIRAMNVFLNLLDYTKLDADTQRRLLADLRDAQNRARKPDTSAPPQPTTETQPQHAPQ